MKKNPETCAVRATAQQAQQELGQLLERREALQREYAPLATWLGDFQEAARRFLACAAAGGAPHAEWAHLLAGLRPLREEEGVPANPDHRPLWAECVARERAALTPLGGKQRLPATPAALQEVIDAAWTAADRESDAFGPTHGFESWDGRLCRTERLDGRGWFLGDAGWIWSAGGRSLPFLRRVAGGQWEAGIAVSRWYLEGSSERINALGGYDSDGAPLPRETWHWRIAAIEK